jgi:hypothetical protein
MRRSIAAVAACMGLTVGLLVAGSPSQAADPAGSAPTDARAEAALAPARSLLGPDAQAARRTASTRRPDASLALRDLFVALPRLDAAQRQEARGLLARPTNGSSDPLGDGYTVPAKRICKKNICLHWVPTTADAPPSGAWVKSNLRFMNKVWRKDLGSRGLYGYCTPERRAKGQKWLASGYCVLDNDFSRTQYGAAPRASLRVTGAHEFFHAVQFAYDYGEDPWLMEATATWMEERVADDVNDNRQYLPYGQVGAPDQPLDAFNQGGFNQYGNWVFFEYLSSRFGTGVVRTIWTRAGAYPGGGHQYSTKAVRSVLGKHGGFVSVYRAFAGGNVVPGHTYREGDEWPKSPAAGGWKLSKGTTRHAATLTVDHMASQHVVVRTGASLKGKRWNLQVVVNGPKGKTSPAAYLVIKTKHGLKTRAIKLNRNGKGHTKIGFSNKSVDSATVVLVNASTRFSCWRRTTSSCQGKARDNNLTFHVRTEVHRSKARRH